MTTTEAGTERLNALRQDIDALDARLVELVAERTRICEAVARIKRDHAIPVMQSDRAATVRSRFGELAAAENLRPAFGEHLYDVILDETCRIESAIISPDQPVAPGSRVRGIDHVAVAVNDLEAAVNRMVDAYGFEVIERRMIQGEHSGMDSATLRAGRATIVLCQGTSPASSVSQYISHVGQGVQHVAFEVDGHEEYVRDVAAAGADLLTGIIHAPGLDQTFTRREPATGLQLEFVTRTNHVGFEDTNVRELFEAMEREGVW